jgi:hypothetical protein
MSDIPKTILISIAEPVAYIKHAMGSLCGHYDFNCNNFINALLNDMFNGFTTEVPLSTAELIREGMEEIDARAAALHVFKAIVSTISEFIPDANFDEDRYRYQLHGEYDLIVMPGNELLASKEALRKAVGDFDGDTIPRNFGLDFDGEVINSHLIFDNSIFEKLEWPANKKLTVRMKSK